MSQKNQNNKEDLEQEYWSILPEETNIEVEYGADVHTSIHGSPFQQVERNAQTFDYNDKRNFDAPPFTSQSLFPVC